MAVAVGGVVLACAPVRAQATDTPTIQCTKWAAQPCVRIPVQAAPTVSHPTLLAGTPAPPRFSESVIVVTIVTNRRVARTRWGGLYGP